MDLVEELQELSEIQENLNAFFLVQYIAYSLLAFITANIILFTMQPIFLDKIGNLFFAEIVCSFICFGFSYITFPLIKKIFSNDKYIFLKKFEEIKNDVSERKVTLSYIKNHYKLN